MLDTNYLLDALSSLSSTQRRIYKAVLAEQRDRQATEGNHDLALIWNAMAVMLAAVDDHERSSLRRLEDGFTNPKSVEQ